jgi:hypothetical protein
MDSTEDDFRPLLGVPPAHTLKLTRLRRKAGPRGPELRGTRRPRHPRRPSSLVGPPAAERKRLAQDRSRWIPVEGARDSMNDLVPALPLLSIPSAQLVPATIAEAGERASWRYVEFFTANINNPHTRRAYARVCGRFFTWCESRGLALTAVRAFDVAAYLESLRTRSPRRASSNAWPRSGCCSTGSSSAR